MSESAKNLNEIVHKLKDIDNVFKFGKKMVPVIEGFVSFISDFIPFIEQVSGSIQESRTKIPEASTQLDNVTNATELAMTEVLDKIDEISDQLEKVNTYVNELSEKQIKSKALVKSLSSHIKGNTEAESLLNDLLETVEFSSTLEMIKKNIETVTASTGQITMSLQVQDITSQQIAAVNHLIISVQHKLGNLLSVVDSKEYDVSEDLEMQQLPDVHFDAKASYVPSNNNQQVDVDSIINKEKASQDEIDKLFS